MATNFRSYNNLTDDQKIILRAFYDNGMNTTAKHMQEIILRAAEQAGATYDQVKKWIGNEKRKRKLGESRTEENKHEDSDDNVLRIGPPLKRVASGYNIFSSSMLSSDLCKAIDSKSEKMRFVSSQWQALSAEEKNDWKSKAKQVDRIRPLELGEDERRKHIAKTKKNLMKEISYLENLGCEVAVVMIEPSGNINQHGSNKGVQFLMQNEAVAIKFMEFFDRPAEDKQHTRADVQNLFNEKYSEACGIPGSRVPYKKGGFTVTGLPEGIIFKKPLNYGSDQIKKVMMNAEEIIFHITRERNINDSKLTHDPLASTSELIPEVVSGKYSIEEKDLEVKDLQITEQEFQHLTTRFRKYFTEDGWNSLKGNYESACNHEGYIIPVYTESDKPYWLFYYPGKISNLLSLEPNAEVWGYWLNQTKEQWQYELIFSNKKMSINAINIISVQENGSSEPILLRRKIVLKRRSQVVVCQSFHDRVIACLENYGYV
ncbi:uncharacterized protein LOC114523901 [Dendronephthya gigantea]|uniref:uncharacterized protein LOC114523901 n=1 Tax=Dendronephthya gigantea TaxID=151771 RepID=UPI001069770F|nr:uncharacterized protein LOC114523901 [Dendronephthya gigantea]